MAVVTFTTDFGSADAYVAAMKGVVLSLAPGAVLVDICHAIPPQDVRTGALILADAAATFPAGSIHVAVVDPGVGGARTGIVVDARDQVFIGPDNGVLSLGAPAPRRIFRIDNQVFRAREVSPTFHGRDVFAVAAGRLAAGHAIDESGARVDGMVEVAMPEPVGIAADATGEVVHVDHFGNLVTSFVSAAPPSGRWQLDCGGKIHALTAARSYADVAPGALILYAGSSGRIEIAVRDGSAARLTAAQPRTLLRLLRLS